MKQPPRLGLLLLAAAALGLASIAPGGSARAAPPTCPPNQSAGPNYYVIFAHGFYSSSLTDDRTGGPDPDNHRVRDDFRVLREAIAAGLSPSPRVIYFSYGAARLLAAGSPPEAAWDGDTYFDEREPRYAALETTNLPLQAHADALGWLVGDVLRCDPAAILHLVGFSLGGVVALRWAATAADGPGSPLNAVRRVVLVDSPVGGVNAALLNQALLLFPRAAALVGDGTALRDLRPDSEVVRSLPAAVDKVDVASIENRRDFIVNGEALPLAMASAAASWLGRGAAVSFLSPDRYPAAYYADLPPPVAVAPSLFDQVLQLHGIVLANADSQQRLLDILRADGPLWLQRQAARASAAAPAPTLTPTLVLPTPAATP